MKLIKMLVFFLGIFTLSFANITKFDNIKNLKIEIQEETYVNNNKKTTYILTFKRPDQVKKEIIFPELNKGEVYIYAGNKKIVYLPFFDQITEGEIDNDEVDMINAINYILNLESKDKEAFEKYQQKKLKDIVVKEGVKIAINNLKSVDGYLVPFEFTIYENDVKVAVLTVKSYKINEKLDEKEFKLE